MITGSTEGAIDNKGPALAALYAMKAVMESGVPVNKKVRLILGPTRRVDGLIWITISKNSPCRTLV